MRVASKLLGVLCVFLIVALWAITLTTDPKPDSISTAAVLTAVVGLIIFLTW